MRSQSVIAPAAPSAQQPAQARSFSPLPHPGKLLLATVTIHTPRPSPRIAARVTETLPGHLRGSPFLGQRSASVNSHQTRCSSERQQTPRRPVAGATGASYICSWHRPQVIYDPHTPLLTVNSSQELQRDSFDTRSSAAHTPPWPSGRVKDESFYQSALRLPYSTSETQSTAASTPLTLSDVQLPPSGVQCDQGNACEGLDRQLLRQTLQQYHEEQNGWREERAALRARLAELEACRSVAAEELAAAQLAAAETHRRTNHLTRKVAMLMARLRRQRTGTRMGRGAVKAKRKY